MSNRTKMILSLVAWAAIIGLVFLALDAEADKPTCEHFRSWDAYTQKTFAISSVGAIVETDTLEFKHCLRLHEDEARALVLDFCEGATLERALARMTSRLKTRCVEYLSDFERREIFDTFDFPFSEQGRP